MSFVAFRLDSSKIIGSGHIQRCVTLANALKKQGFAPLFICKNFEGHFNHIASEQGYPVNLLPADLSELEDAHESAQLLRAKNVKILIVDNYNLSQEFEEPFYRTGTKVIVIDDLMNRPHLCHILLDQNTRQDKLNAYKGLVPKACQLFLGSKYALIRPEFYVLKPKKLSITAKNILVFFGGSDPTGETYRFIKDTNYFSDDIPYSFHIVVSTGNWFLKEIQQIPLKKKIKIYINPDMADLMSNCDFYFGSGGTITWERMALGLTGYVVSVAENQVPSSQVLHQKKFHVYLGKCEDINFKEVPKLISNFDFSAIDLHSQEGPSKCSVNDFIKSLST